MTSLVCLSIKNFDGFPCDAALQIEYVHLYTRSGGQMDNYLDNDDIDSVELEKSNVLLIGPTGSGKLSILIKICQVVFIGIILKIRILFGLLSS